MFMSALRTIIKLPRILSSVFLILLLTAVFDGSVRSESVVEPATQTTSECLHDGCESLVTVKRTSSAIKDKKCSRRTLSNPSISASRPVCQIQKKPHPHHFLGLSPSLHQTATTILLI